MRDLLDNAEYAQAAEECSGDLRSCLGAAGAADFIETAPHDSNGFDVINALNRNSVKFRIAYWAAAAALMIFVGALFGWKYCWLVGIPTGILSYPLGKLFAKLRYKALIRRAKPSSE